MMFMELPQLKAARAQRRTGISCALGASSRFISYRPPPTLVSALKRSLRRRSPTPDGTAEDTEDAEGGVSPNGPFEGTGPVELCR